MSKKVWMTYRQYRLAKRDGEIVQQTRTVKVYDDNPWYTLFGLNYSREYTEWEDVPFVNANDNE